MKIIRTFIYLSVLFFAISGCTKLDVGDPFVVCGYVLNKSTLNPVVNAKVELTVCSNDDIISGNSMTKDTLSDINGYFELWANGCEDRSYILKISKDGFNQKMINDVDLYDYAFRKCLEHEVLLDSIKNE